MLAVSAFLPVPRTRAEPRFQVVANQTAYNTGSVVQLRIVPLGSDSASPTHKLFATLRYAGEERPVLDRIPLVTSGKPLSRGDRNNEDAYREFWRIPPDARTGRYEVDLVVEEAASRGRLLTLPRAGSFAVYRKLIQVEEFKLDRTFYTSGDRVACRVKLRNLTGRALSGLRVEFSDRYWPWIGTAEGSDLHIVSLAQSLSLTPHGLANLSSPHAAKAATLEQPSIHQYALVVWDRTRSDIYDIAFSPLAWIGPPGTGQPKLYPPQYLHPTLGVLKFESHRQADPPSVSIQFDRSHTLWPAGSKATIGFSVIKTAISATDAPGERLLPASVLARLVGPDGAEVSNQVVPPHADLRVDPRSNEASATRTVAFSLPSQAGLYRAVVEVREVSGKVLAANSLDLGVNPLPKSILVFCAHEDDEGGHAGLYRAAVENHIPVRFLYFTSGDAGSCDRYYQHSCDAAEALNFGALRMDEVRGAMGHLGVPREDIYFAGLPDGGSGEIWGKHLRPPNLYLDPLLATDRAPYEGLLQPNLPYAREPVLQATEEFIRRFQPDLIYTAHPSNVRHIDHIVTNYFVVKALQHLLREGALAPDLKLLVDEVRDAKHQPPTPYHYGPYPFYVSGEARTLGQEASWFHQSQTGNHAEVESKSQLSRTESFRQVLDWQQHEGWNEKN